MTKSNLSPVLVGYQLDALEAFTKNPRGLYMAGATGIGKSVLIQYIREHGGIPKRCEVLSVPRETFRLARGHAGSLENFEERVSSARVVALEDLGAEPDHWQTYTFMLLEALLTRKVRVIVTTNRTKEALKELYDAHILSRLSVLGYMRAPAEDSLDMRDPVRCKKALKTANMKRQIRLTEKLRALFAKQGKPLDLNADEFDDG